MEMEDDGRWRINGKHIPEWIQQARDNIAAAIEQGLAEAAARAEEMRERFAVTH